MNTFAKIALAATLLTAPIAANAALVFDYSPDTTGFNSTFVASNIASQQNFLVSFTLATATTLNGADIYSECPTFGCGGGVGDAVVIKFRSDVGGSPDTVNLLTLNSTISAIDSLGSSANPAVQRLHADFTGTSFAAGTYWFGLSGVNEIGWSLDFSLPSNGWWQLGGDSLQFGNNNVTAAFNLYGGTVPEPASWAMMIAGFALVGAAQRRATRRRALTA